MKLSEVIKNYRQENNLSVRSFAEKCGISCGYISMLENGVQPTTGRPIKPSIDVLYRIADVTGIPLNNLLSTLDRNQAVSLSVPKNSQAPSCDMVINLPDEKRLIEIYRMLEDSKKAEAYKYITQLL